MKRPGTPSPKPSSNTSGNTKWLAKVERITPITTADYPTPAQRPAYSVLNNDKLTHTFGVRLPDWREALRQVHEDIDSLGINI